MDNLIPQFFARSPYAEKKVEAMNAVSNLGVIPILTPEDIEETPDFSACPSDYALYINCHINMHGLSLKPCFYIIDAGLNPILNLDDVPHHKIIYQIKNLDEAHWALAQNPLGLIVKGNEASGVVGEDSTFILFQKIRQLTSCPLWLRGGVGIHTSAAALALGAQGLVLIGNTR
jgi:hypothetical protein